MSVSVLLVPYSPALKEQLERQSPTVNPFREVRGVKLNKKVVSLLKIIQKAYPALNADKLCLLGARGKGEDYVTMSHAGVTIGDFVEADSDAGSHLQSADGNVAYVLRYALDATAAVETGVVDLTPAMMVEYLAKTGLTARVPTDACATAVTADKADAGTAAAGAPAPPRPPTAAGAAPPETTGPVGLAPAPEAVPAAASELAAALANTASVTAAADVPARGGPAGRQAAGASSSGAANPAALWRQQTMKNKLFNRALSRAATAREPGEARGLAAPSIRPTVCVDEPRFKPRQPQAKPPTAAPAARSSPPHDSTEACAEAGPPAAAARPLMTGLLLQPCEQSTDGFSSLSPMAGANRYGDASSSGNSVFGELSTDGFGGSLLHEAPRQHSCGEAAEAGAARPATNRACSFSAMFSRLGGAATGGACAGQSAAVPSEQVPPASPDVPPHGDPQPKGQRPRDADTEAELFAPDSAAGAAPREAPAAGAAAVEPESLAGRLSRAAGAGATASPPTSWPPSRNRRDTSLASAEATTTDASPALFAALRGRLVAPSPASSHGGAAWVEADLRGNDDSVGSFELFGGDDDSSPAAEPPSLPSAAPPSTPPLELRPAGGGGTSSRQAAGESTPQQSQPASPALGSSRAAARAMAAEEVGAAAPASPPHHDPPRVNAVTFVPDGDTAGTCEGGLVQSAGVAAQLDGPASEPVSTEAEGLLARAENAEQAVEEGGDDTQLRRATALDSDDLGILSPSVRAVAAPAGTPVGTPAGTPTIRRSSSRSATMAAARAATPQPPTTPACARSARSARQSSRAESREEGEISVEPSPRRTPQPNRGRGTDRAGGSAKRRRVVSPVARPHALSPSAAAPPAAPCPPAASPPAHCSSHPRVHLGPSTEPKQPAADSAGEASGDAPGDVSRDVSGDAPGDVSRDVSGDAPGDVSRDLSGDAPGDVSRDVSGDAPGDLCKDVSGGVSGGISRDVTRDVSRGRSGDVSGDASKDMSGDVSRDVSQGAARVIDADATKDATKGASKGAARDCPETPPGPGRSTPAAAGVPRRSPHLRPRVTSADSAAEREAAAEPQATVHPTAQIGEQASGGRTATKKATSEKAEFSLVLRHELARKERHDIKAQLQVDLAQSTPVISKKVSAEAQQLQSALPGASASGGYRIRKKPARAHATASSSAVSAPAHSARGRPGVAAPPDVRASPRNTPATAPLAEALPHMDPGEPTGACASGLSISRMCAAARTIGDTAVSPGCGSSNDAVAGGESEDEMLTVAEIRAIGKRQRDTADPTSVGGGRPSGGQCKPRPLSPSRPQPSSSKSRSTEPTAARLAAADPQPSLAPAKRPRAALSSPKRRPAERQLSPIRHALDPYLDAEIERDGEVAFLERTRSGALQTALRARAPDDDAGG